jgi:putative transposase
VRWRFRLRSYLKKNLDPPQIARDLLTKLPGIPRSTITKALGVSRSGSYVGSKQEQIDQRLVNQIQAIKLDHPFYGQQRLQIALDFQGIRANHKRLRRVCQLYGIQAKRRPKRWVKPADSNREGSGIPNLVKPLVASSLITRPNQVWCADFTYLSINGIWYYLATQIDAFTKEIVGFSLSTTHNTDLVAIGLF